MSQDIYDRAQHDIAKGSQHDRFTLEAVDQNDEASVKVVENSSGLQKIMLISWVGGAEEKFLTTGKDARITQKVGQILGSVEADHLINQLHYKMPHDEVSFPWHQDIANRKRFDPNWQDVNKRGSFVQVITALDPSTADNGPIIILQKSHLAGEVDLANQGLLNQLLTEYQQIPILLEPGDTLFMHPLLVHKSEANRSEVSRMLFVNGYASVGANHQQYPGVSAGKTVKLSISDELLQLTESILAPQWQGQPNEGKELMGRDALISALNSLNILDATFSF